MAQIPLHQHQSLETTTTSLDLHLTLCVYIVRRGLLC
jgi:hypothetical protein